MSDDDITLKDDPSGSVVCFFNEDHLSQPGDIVFSVDGGKEMLRICADGTFTVKGKPVAEDIEIYIGMRDFLVEAAMLAMH